MKQRTIPQSLMVNNIDNDQIKLDMHQDHYLIKVACLYNSYLHHQYRSNMMKPSTKKKDHRRVKNKIFNSFEKEKIFIKYD